MTTNRLKTIFIIILCKLLFSGLVFAQEEPENKFNTGVDFYSNYIWRGSVFGTGPAIQPSLEFVSGNFAMGVWGSFDAHGYQEADLYLNYNLFPGLVIGFTDYYYPALRYFDYSSISGSHAFEASLRFERSGFSLQANYIINQAGGAGSLGGDKYFEAGYDFGSFNIFAGAGDGWHTYDPETGTGRFNVCNVGIGTTRTIKVTDSFKIPLTGQIVINPDQEKLIIVAGFSF
ncbi:MAG: hypothetical protein K0B05_06445 [Bacteroidales bacterium]|nr:hypothetical protein [Bacteroidales bacterium]